MTFHNLDVSTGFYEIDSMLGGLKRGQTYLLGSRPGMGKTAFALCIVNNLVLHEKRTVVYFSPAERDDGRFCEAWEKTVGANVFIDNTPDISVDMILETCSLVSKPIDLIVVDYLQLVVQRNPINGSYYSEFQICQLLSDVADKFNCPVLILSQLSRTCELREDHHPVKKDLTDSMIDMAVDNIFFLFRDDYYNEDSLYLNIAEFYIAKEEYSSMDDSAILVWLPEYCVFCSVDR